MSGANHEPRTDVGPIRARLRAIRPHRRPVIAVLALNATALLIAWILHRFFDVGFAFDEGGLINTLDGVELVLAGALGVLTWRRSRAAPPPAGTPVSPFWGLSGVGLIACGIDDLGGLHERIGDGIADRVDVSFLGTNHPDDVVTFAYAIAGLALVAAFRHEVTAARASSALYAVAVVASALMVLVDMYGRGPVNELEFPFQVSAVGLLLAAHIVRVRERAIVGIAGGGHPPAT